MFTTGQLIFAIIFVIAFVITMALVYRKDRAWQKLHYKGTRWVLFGFVIFILFLFFVKFFIKK